LVCLNSGTEAATAAEVPFADDELKIFVNSVLGARFVEMI
jgi:hypothetical protein